MVCRCMYYYIYIHVVRSHAILYSCIVSVCCYVLFGVSYVPVIPLFCFLAGCFVVAVWLARYYILYTIW